MRTLIDWRFQVLALVSCIFGCASPQSRPGGVAPFQASDHTGVWVSDGYGYVVEIAPERVRSFHIAGDICLEQPAGESSILDFLDLYRTTEAREALHLFGVLDPFEYTFRRAPALPAQCTTPAPNTPLGNFDALAAYFRAHYAFFDLYGVDWDARVASARGAISSDMDDHALFAAMSDLLRPLRDSHIQIDANIDGAAAIYDGNRGDTEIRVAELGERQGLSAGDAAGRFRREYWLNDIRDQLLMGEGVMAGNGRVQYGVLADSVGYIAFASMGGFVDGEFDTAYEERAALDAIMDEALALFAARGVNAVVIDLSLNIGGYDFIGLDIAGRFASRRALAFTRRAGDDPSAEDFPIYVEPSSARRFTGSVYVLTSDLTVSAAEILTLGLRALDNVTHVGETTRGAFSTVLTKYLPNGWELSLSNEVYTDPNGVVWEGRGLEPEVRISVFHPENPMAGHVDAVRASARLARGGGQPH